MPVRCTNSHTGGGGGEGGQEQWLHGLSLSVHNRQSNAATAEVKHRQTKTWTEKEVDRQIRQTTT